MDFKAEELRFMNMKKIPVYASNPYMRDGLTVYEIEQALTEDEKMAIIDQWRGGIASYLYGILQKWEEEKDALPKNAYGNPKTVSKKAWIKRNDTRGIIDVKYRIGTYSLFGTEFQNLKTVCPQARYGYDLEYTGESVVHQWFHGLCDEWLKEERKYYQENNPIQIKLARVLEYSQRHDTNFGNDLLHDIIWNGETNVNEEQLDVFLEAYEQLEKYIEEISKTVNEKEGSCL